MSTSFSGSDPYDGLNSRLLAPLAKHARATRLALIQIVRRCPLNLRGILRIPPGSNPKGSALFLSGLSDYCKLDQEGRYAVWLEDLLLSQASGPEGDPIISPKRTIQNGLARKLLDNGFEGNTPMGWGYHFPWQGRAFYLAAWLPNVVCTSFVLDSFADAGSELYPAIALSTAQLVAHHLNRFEDDSGICFSYSPADDSKVFNASLFGAKILARAAKHSGTHGHEWADMARKAVTWVISRQQVDGSWSYGETSYWKAADNLHTGFVLETLEAISQLLGTTEWDEHIERGLTFYRYGLFMSDFTAKYYSDSLYPIDPHSFAQGTVTFLRLARFDQAAKDTAKAILERGIELLWDDRRSGFIYRINRTGSVRTIHLRWSQAWMFRALCLYLGSAA